MNVLMVDDHEDYVRLFEKWFSVARPSDSIRCHSVESKFLEAFREEIPDVVLLDVFMEERNGFQIARELRSDPRGARVKIFLLTGIDCDLLSDPDLSGVNGFLSKGLGFKRIMEKVS